MIIIHKTNFSTGQCGATINDGVCLTIFTGLFRLMSSIHVIEEVNEVGSCNEIKIKLQGTLQLTWCTYIK